MKEVCLLASLLAHFFARCQSLPVEVMAGNRNYWHQHTVSRQGEKYCLGFFNTHSAYFFYESKVVEVMMQSYLTLRLNKHFKLSAGTFYASAPGLKPSVNLQFRHSGRDWILLLAPRMDIHKNLSHDLYVSFEYRPAITGSVGAYLRLQAMSNYTGRKHNRSYQLLRIGASLKRMQFGAAVNFDAYGREMKYYYNYGFFLKKDIL